MKKGLLILSVSTLTAIIILMYILPNNKIETFSPHSRIEIIAHRGFEDMYPENTIYAAKQAVGLGAPPEFDVQFTADGEMIVIHDASVDRTTNGTGLVSSLNYSYIEKLDAGSKFSKSFAGLRVPKFTDYLKSVKDSPYIYPELKNYRNVYDIIKFTEALLDNGFEKRATILSFDYEETLPVIRLKSRLIKVGALCKNANSLKDALKLANIDKHSMILIPVELASSETLNKCSRDNIDVAVWTIHDANMLKKLKNMGYSKFICSKYIKTE